MHQVRRKHPAFFLIHQFSIQPEFSYHLQDIHAEEAVRDWGPQAAATINYDREKIDEDRQEIAGLLEDIENANMDDADAEERLQLSASLIERQ
jgi:hypothetical protein